MSIGWVSVVDWGELTNPNNVYDETMLGFLSLPTYRTLAAQDLDNFAINEDLFLNFVINNLPKIVLITPGCKLYGIIVIFEVWPKAYNFIE